jgi:hypothetical protein
MANLGKSLLLACLIAPLSFGQPESGLISNSNQSLQPVNGTKAWSFPYTSPPGKSKRVHEGIPTILKEKVGTPISKFIEILGTPDLIEDFSKSPHMGLSPKEDSMMMQHSQYIKYRVIWYLTKNNSSLPNFNDSWFAAYVTVDGATVYKVMKNNLE